MSRNSIQCRECNKWIHKKYSGVKGKLKEDPGFRCVKCVRGGCAEGGAEEQEVVLENGSCLECINRFCYLGDMLETAGSFAEASRTTVNNNNNNNGFKVRLGIRRRHQGPGGLGDSSRSLPSC